MTVPDAWDECAACGHDRDDHVTLGCAWPDCECPLFVDEPAT